MRFANLRELTMKSLLRINSWERRKLRRDTERKCFAIKSCYENTSNKENARNECFPLLLSIFSMLQSITIERKEVRIDLDSWYYFSPDALESRRRPLQSRYSPPASYCTVEETVAQENIRPTERERKRGTSGLAIYWRYNKNGSLWRWGNREKRNDCLKRSRESDFLVKSAKRGGLEIFFTDSPRDFPRWEESRDSDNGSPSVSPGDNDRKSPGCSVDGADVPEVVPCCTYGRR